MPLGVCAFLNSIQVHLPKDIRKLFLNFEEVKGHTFFSTKFGG